MDTMEKQEQKQFIRDIFLSNPLYFQLTKEVLFELGYQLNIVDTPHPAILSELEKLFKFDGESLA